MAVSGTDCLKQIQDAASLNFIRRLLRYQKDFSHNRVLMRYVCR